MDGLENLQVCDLNEDNGFTWDRSMVETLFHTQVMIYEFYILVMMDITIPSLDIKWQLRLPNQTLGMQPWESREGFGTWRFLKKWSTFYREYGKTATPQGRGFYKKAL